MSFESIFRKAFYLILLISFFWNYFFIASTFKISLGVSQFREIDIMMVLFFIVWIFVVLSKKEGIPSLRTYRKIYLLIIILIMPFFVGLLDGKSIRVMIRDVRTPFFYFSIIPMISIFKSQDDIVKFFKFIVIVGVLGSLGGIALWIMSGGLYESGTRRFALANTHPAVVLSMFLSIAFLMFHRTSKRHSTIAKLIILFSLIFVFGANDSRSMFLGTISGIISLFISRFSVKKANALPNRRSFNFPYIRFVSLFAIFVSLLYLLLNVFEKDIVKISESNSLIRRIYGLYNPVVDIGRGSSQREDRLYALSYAYELGTENYGFGLGYGDNAFVKIDNQFLRTRQWVFADNPGNYIENIFLVHNAYAWAFGRLGFWPAIFYFISILYIILGAWKYVHRTESKVIRVIISTNVAYAIYTLVSGFGGGGFFDYMGSGMIPWLICLTLLIRIPIIEVNAECKGQLREEQLHRLGLRRGRFF